MRHRALLGAGLLYAALAVVVNTLAANPTQGGIELLILATGVPAYFIWRRRGAAP